jgi:DNA-binding response OmpR family regulator
MQPAHIVLLQSDPRVAQLLSASLRDSFHSVHVVQSIDELRNTTAKHRPHAVILDLESISLEQIEELKQQFDGVRLVCNHRVADEEMWTRTLSAGADDCCPSCDTRGILLSAVQSVGKTHAMVA